jgi:hypothetical protein
MPNTVTPGVVLAPGSPLDNKVQRISDDPGAPSVTATPGDGTTLWTYAVVGRDEGGGSTPPSPDGVTFNGSATLDATHFNTIAWVALPGVTSYDVINRATNLYVATGITGLSVDDTAGPAAYQFQFFNDTLPFVADPVSAPTVTVVGTPGSAFYSFFIVALSGFGQTFPSPSAFLFNAPNQLSGTDYLTVSWDPVPGAVSYDLIDGSSSVLIATGLTTTTFNVQTQLPRAAPVLQSTIQAVKIANGLRFTNDSNIHWDANLYGETMGLFWPANDLIPGQPGVQADSMGIVASGEALFYDSPSHQFSGGAAFQGTVTAYKGVFSSNDDAVTPLRLQRYSATATAPLLQCLDELGGVVAALDAQGGLSATGLAIGALEGLLAENWITAPTPTHATLIVQGPASGAHALLEVMPGPNDAFVVYSGGGGQTVIVQANDDSDVGLAAYPNSPTHTGDLFQLWANDNLGTVFRVGAGPTAATGTVAFFGVPLAGQQSVPAAAVDPATTMALANALRALVLTFGLGQ